MRTDTGTSEFFDIVTGVRQGCILSPMLFLLAIDYVIRKTTSGHECGISWTKQTRLADLDFADDIALLAESREKLQQLTTRLEKFALKIGLRINIKKTQVMQMSREDEDLLMPITIGNQPLTDIDRFTYFGSVIAQDGDAEPDVTQRIGKAANVFQRMRNIWKSPSINTSLKIRLYMSIVLPMAIYASETWKNTVRIGHKLDVFHQQCLRYILHVTYHDHVTNEEILRRAKTPRLSSIVSERRIKLAGHILRQPEQRLAKIAMTWMPPNGW